MTIEKKKKADSGPPYVAAQVAADVKQELEDLAWARRTSVADLLRQAITRFLADESSGK